MFIESDGSLASALAALIAQDEARLGPVFALTGMPPLRRRAPGFEGLVWIIVSQQVSVASANAIMARVKTGFAMLEPLVVLTAGDEKLRSCGLSAPKIRTLQALGTALTDGSLDLVALAELSPEAAHKALVAVKGIGPWTADIFLLFCLGHPDAWPVGDLALQEAVRLVFGLENRPNAREMAVLAEGWRPYRAVAARLLWAFYKVKKAREGVS
eukprot:gene2333-2372_t